MTRGEQMRGLWQDDALPLQAMELLGDSFRPGDLSKTDRISWPFNVQSYRMLISS
jgi:hypothetical protein